VLDGVDHSSTNIVTHAASEAITRPRWAPVSRRTRRRATFTAESTMRNAALAIMAIGPRSKTSTKAIDSAPVMKRPST